MSRLQRVLDGVNAFLNRFGRGFDALLLRIRPDVHGINNRSTHDQGSQHKVETIASC